MQLGLIISNDWEPFGDGSGDYFELQHRPLKSLLETMEKYSAKLTVMAEVGQQWAHQRIIDREPWAKNVVEAWESILRETIKRHHDVQLHLHPQWLNAEYKNRKWNVDLNNWAISSLPSATMADILKEGKLYLENLLNPVNSSYSCVAFRAGAYCIEPSRTVIENLVNAGIICDTSVTKGFYNRGFFDYRDAYSNFFPWLVSQDNIKYQSDSDGKLLEIPIYSYKTIDFPILRKLISPQLYYLISSCIWLDKRDKKWLLERNRNEFQRYPIRDRPFLRTNKMTSARWLLSKMIAKASMQLNYDILPPKLSVKSMEEIFEDRNVKAYKNSDIIIPIMATGYVKLAHNWENIERILHEIQIRLKGRIIYWTLRDAVSYWLKERPWQIS